MAIILPPGARVCTAAGLPISGGKVRVYDANTTDLADLFSNEALSVALSNPVICNSAGYPATNSGAGSPTLVFAASATYDVAYLDASNNVLASWDDTPSVGEDTGAFARTMPDGTRLTFTGSGGRVLMQVGDPSPDNTGGKLTIEGRAGTQADEILLDAAAFDTTGFIKENAKPLAAVVSSLATAFSAASTVDIPLPNSPAGVTAYEVMIWGLTHSAATTLLGRYSFNGGGAYVATGYDGLATNLAGATATVAADGTATSFPIANGLAGDTNKPTTVRLLIFTVNGGSDWTTSQAYSTGYIPGSGEHGTTLACGFSSTGNGRATHLRLLPGSGTITGNYRVTPLRGSGDT